MIEVLKLIGFMGGLTGLIFLIGWIIFFVGHVYNNKRNITAILNYLRLEVGKARVIESIEKEKKDGQY